MKRVGPLVLDGRNSAENVGQSLSRGARPNRFFLARSDRCAGAETAPTFADCIQQSSMPRVPAASPHLRRVDLNDHRLWCRATPRGMHSNECSGPFEAYKAIPSWRPICHVTEKPRTTALTCLPRLCSITGRQGTMLKPKPSSSGIEREHQRCPPHLRTTSRPGSARCRQSGRRPEHAPSTR